ncbi:MAG: hypothetical protein AABY22_03750, partial [Nanoarchaeota archaeon]
LEINEPIICEIICPENQPIIPTIGAFKDKDGKICSKPLYDMKPYLTEKEMNEELIIRKLV